MEDWIPFGGDKDTQTCPDNFYPAFSCPLGAPSGPPALVGPGNVWQRRFAHALVHVDMDIRVNSGVVWDSCKL